MFKEIFHTITTSNVQTASLLKMKFCQYDVVDIRFEIVVCRRNKMFPTTTFVVLIAEWS